MISTLQVFNSTYQVNLSKPLDISIPIGSKKKWVKAWYVNDATIKQVEGDGFIGAVALGGSVNFRDICFNPHGNGTHTECVGHITEKVHSVNQNLKQFFFPAQVISVAPQPIGNDLVITRGQIESAQLINGIEAIVIRTLPNGIPNKDLSNTNPPFLDVEATKLLVDWGIKHLLIDQPSVDKEVDGGALASHHAFWNTKGNIRYDATITEFIYVDDSILDGLYLLNLQVAAFENDASPSRPVLFELQKA